ncbi:hypothetical protein SeMB42_g05633 [Synchytrium endobioticum]|uniref:Uncharacterized protein n=1 Tax=Synchytrium endobioticum TaxID=286115 RepID=A0A507CQD5_9FUNG|nr:hypothetical protein SeMB42_g05633 [Synchytrium endobioticum]
MPSSRADANMSPDAISHNQSGDASDSVASIFAHPQRAAGPATATDADPIIRQLLANRAKMTDVSDAHEDERQRRMYNMLRHSHQYRRLQVRDANAKWGDDLAALDAALASEQQPIATPTHPAPLATVESRSAWILPTSSPFPPSLLFPTRNAAHGPASVTMHMSRKEGEEEEQRHWPSMEGDQNAGMGPCGWWTVGHGWADGWIVVRLYNALVVVRNFSLIVNNHNVICIMI